MLSLPPKVHSNWWEFNYFRPASWLVIKLQLKPNPLVVESPLGLPNTCWKIIKRSEELAVHGGGWLPKLCLARGRKLFPSIMTLKKQECLSDIAS